MKKITIGLLTSCVIATGVSAQPPTTHSLDQGRVYHGQTVKDPYAWLEDAKSPEVMTWIEAQNSYAKNKLSLYPGGEALAKRISELALTAATQTSPRIAGKTLFYMLDTPPAPQPVLVSKAWPGGRSKILVDTNSEAKPSAISDFWPSPSGKYLAYSTAVGGNELATISFIETATGKKLPNALINAAGGTTPPSLSWDEDEQGVTYVRLPQDSLFNASLYHHSLNSSSASDSPTFGQGLSPIAEWELTNSDSGNEAAALVHKGDGAPTMVALRQGKEWKMVCDESLNIRSGGSWLDSDLLVVSYQDAARGKVIAISPDGKLRTLIPQSTWAVKEVHAVKDGILVSRVWGAAQKLEHYSAQGKLIRTVALPSTGISVGSIASSSSSKSAIITYSGWTTPQRWVSYDAQSGKLETIFELKPVGDYSQIALSHLTAISKDGSKVPISVLHHKSVQPGAPHPTILYGYGGFGIIVGPSFLGPNLAWLERGGVYAVANIRGGGEYGESWHQGGMKTNKQNVFDDFYACAQALKDSRWTDSRRLGIMGGSNGGLLVGATMVQHPQDFGAVVGLVGVMDSLGHERFPNGAFNVPEYGSSEVESEFEAILRYSPYQNVAAASYPPVLLQTGENDLRVAPWQTRKFGAALQNSTTSNNPILIVTETNAGHGQGASFAQKVGKTALALSFMAQHLGLGQSLIKP